MNTNTNLERKTAAHGVPWEEAYSYYQAVQVKDVIYVSGQLSHDKDGNFIAPAELGADGKPVDGSAMEAQMRQTYKNAIAMLAEFGATLDDVVEETLFVTDVEAAFAVAGKVRKEMYGVPRPLCASNLIGVAGLSQPVQLIEITFRAVLK
ncbi:RidA family protein [Telluria beijingensis]|uniref:RidA family protein n=1 Tax=Telluria beijingensis TaxID=3068633 RepID=UPI002795288A|nr:Rid family hydrolase [Massilia sp. REN29]